MKRNVFVIVLVALLLALTLSVAFAEEEMEDPVLCVAGKWLIVQYADPTAVRVTVPEDTPYGDQQAGGCTTPMPNVPIIQAVRERGEHHIMRVWVNGADASRPTVTVSYGSASQTKHNNGHRLLNFFFLVR